MKSYFSVVPFYPLEGEREKHHLHICISMLKQSIFFVFSAEHANVKLMEILKEKFAFKYSKVETILFVPQTLQTPLWEHGSLTLVATTKVVFLNWFAEKF